MFDVNQILEMDKLNQRTVYAAVRIAAFIAKNNRSVSEQEVKKALKLTDLTWAAVKSDLNGKILLFKGGRIDLINDENRPDPWDIVEPPSKKELRELERIKNRPTAKPLGPMQQRMVDILSIDPRKAYSFQGRFKTSHSDEALNHALDIVKQKIDRDGPLDQPVGYFQAILKRNGAGTKTTDTAQPARKYPIFIKRTEPAARILETTFIGWENTSQTDPTGEPIWPTGVRRKIFRLRSGELHFAIAEKGEKIPTLKEDPGCVIQK